MALAQPHSLCLSSHVVHASLPAVRSEREGLGSHRSKHDTSMSRDSLYGIHSFFIKNLFYKSVRPEICQNIKNIPEAQRRAIYFITAFTFLNPENLVYHYIMSYMESECM